MMVHVKEGQLVEALLQDDKHSIKEVQDLRDVEHIEDESDGRVGLVELAAHHGVAGLPRLHEGFNAHVRAQHDLDHVVGKLDAIKATHGRADILHDETAEEHEAQVADGDLGSGGEVRQGVALPHTQEMQVSE
jgi:hypothetical protein